MSQQTTGQRWCSLVLLAVFLSLFMYYGLPAMAFRIGRAIEAGQRFDGTAQSFEMSTAVPFRDEPASPFVRASRDVRPAVVRIEALLTPEASGGEAAVESSEADPAVRRSRGCGVVIDPNGFVLTSHRVVCGATHVFL
jgi:S1-C subfamily serine protease